MNEQRVSVRPPSGTARRSPPPQSTRWKTVAVTVRCRPGWRRGADRLLHVRPGGEDPRRCCRGPRGRARSARSARTRGSRRGDRIARRRSTRGPDRRGSASRRSDWERERHGGSSARERRAAEVAAREDRVGEIGALEVRPAQIQAPHGAVQPRSAPARSIPPSGSTSEPSSSRSFASSSTDAWRRLGSPAPEKVPRPRGYGLTAPRSRRHRGPRPRASRARSWSPARAPRGASRPRGPRG